MIPRKQHLTSSLLAAEGEKGEKNVTDISDSLKTSVVFPFAQLYSSLLGRQTSPSGVFLGKFERKNEAEA